jgi:8-oxo-dGTP diphosphatase
VGAALWLAAVLQFQKNGETFLCFDSGYPVAQETWQRRFGRPQFELVNRWGEGTRHMIWKLSTDVAMRCMMKWLSVKRPCWYQTSLPEACDYTVRPGAYAVLVKAHRVGVIKTKTGYFLAGGGIEAGETPEAALKRECMEEIGVTIEHIEYLGVGEHYFKSIVDQMMMQSIGYFFKCQIEAFAGEETEPDHELVWLSPDEAAEKLYLAHQRIAVAMTMLNDAS